MLYLCSNRVSCDQRSYGDHDCLHYTSAILYAVGMSSRLTCSAEDDAMDLDGTLHCCSVGGL